MHFPILPQNLLFFQHSLRQGFKFSLRNKEFHYGQLAYPKVGNPLCCLKLFNFACESNLLFFILFIFFSKLSSLF